VKNHLDHDPLPPLILLEVFFEYLNLYLSKLVRSIRCDGHQLLKTSVEMIFRPIFL
jgi:hypothetical protein